MLKNFILVEDLGLVATKKEILKLIYYNKDTEKIQIQIQ